MEKEFIPYEQALKLKELGFNEKCGKAWSNKGVPLISITSDGFPWSKTNLENEKETNGYCISAPTFYQTFRWFREKHNISCTIDWMTRVEGYYSGYIVHFRGINSHKLNEENLFVLNSESSEGYAVYKTYEEAELACLNKLIEIIDKEKTVLIDPPSGWKYGFPKAYKFKGKLPDNDVLYKWLVDNGYPQAEIDALGQYFYLQISGDV